MRLPTIAICCLATACHKRHAPTVERTDAVTVPMSHDTFKLDGELNEPDWNRLAHPKPFVADGHEARPYSQVRMLHDATNLYIGLYAADQDIRSASDKFEVTIGAVQLAVNPAGEVTPALPGVHAGHDLDGTLDQSEDQDEEWVIELAVPLATIGLHADGPMAFIAKRCDTPKDGVTRCGSWGSPIVLGSD